MTDQVMQTNADGVAPILRGASGKPIELMSGHPLTKLGKGMDQAFADGNVKDILNNPRITTTKRI